VSASEGCKTAGGLQRTSGQWRPGGLAGVDAATQSAPPHKCRIGKSSSVSPLWLLVRDAIGRHQFKVWRLAKKRGGTTMLQGVRLTNDFFHALRLFCLCALASPLFNRVRFSPCHHATLHFRPRPTGTDANADAPVIQDPRCYIEPLSPTTPPPTLQLFSKHQARDFCYF